MHGDKPCILLGVDHGSYFLCFHLLAHGTLAEDPLLLVPFGISSLRYSGFSLDLFVGRGHAQRKAGLSVG
jgi:hypothetical protein